MVSRSQQLQTHITPGQKEALKRRNIFVDSALGDRVWSGDPGVRSIEQPKDRLIKDDSGLLTWKENDRAVATFKNMTEIEDSKSDLDKIIKDWIGATS